MKKEVPMYLSLKELEKRCKTIISVPHQPELKNKEKSFVRLLEEKALMKFISKRDIRLDFQKLDFRDVTIILVNLSRAVVKEAQEFYKFLLTSIENGSRKILIDLTSVEHIDSSFAGVLVAAIKKINHLNGNIKLVMNNDKTDSHPLLVNGLNKVFEIYSSIKEGLKSYNISLSLV